MIYEEEDEDITGDCIYISNILDQEDIIRRENIVECIINAFDNNALSVNYQPIYDLKENRFIKFEALIRLYSNKLNETISPGEFIPIAEELGFISEFGYFVIEEACKNILKLNELKFNFTAISVNVSPLQLYKQDFAKRVVDIISRYNIKPELIELEITESSNIKNYELVNSAISELNAVGIRFTLDDFGQGYSNLSNVINILIHGVKIDCSLVNYMENDIKKRILIKDLIVLFNNLDKEVVVEGIENRVQLELLKEMGCRYIQGFYISRPLSESALYEFI